MHEKEELLAVLNRFAHDLIDMKPVLAQVRKELPEFKWQISKHFIEQRTRQGLTTINPFGHWDDGCVIYPTAGSALMVRYTKHGPRGTAQMKLRPYDPEFVRTYLRRNVFTPLKPLRSTI